LAVKPLTMSGSPSHRGSVRRVSRSQVTHVPISKLQLLDVRDNS